MTVNWFWIAAAVAVFTAVIFLLHLCLQYIKKIKFKIQSMKAQLDEIYHITNENNRLLLELGNSQERDRESYYLDYSWSMNNPIVCHALGEIDGVKFTESREAFEKHYNQGSRVFELDFSLTSDGEPVVLHDWNHFLNRNVAEPEKANFSMKKALSKVEFEAVKILGKYTPLTLERFIQLAEQYKDAYFIISVKSVDQQYDEDAQLIFRKLFDMAMAADQTLCRHFILHAYSMEFLHRAMKEFPFGSVVYRIYHSIHPLVLAKQLKESGITMVTTTLGSWPWAKQYLKILHEHDIRIISCSMEQKKTLKKRLQERDIDMVMTPYGEEIRL